MAIRARSSKRLLRRLAVAVLLGIATTVLVAQLLAAMPESWRREERFLIPLPRARTSEAQLLRSTGLCRVSWRRRVGLMVIHDTPLGQKLAPAPDWGLISKMDESMGAAAGLDIASGWPWLAMQGSVVADGVSPSVQFVGAVPLARLSSVRALDEIRILPYHIMPANFAADSGVYAVAWFAFLEGGLAARRWMRGRRGRCRMCGYSRTSLPAGSPCPECGS